MNENNLCFKKCCVNLCVCIANIEYFSVVANHVNFKACDKLSNLCYIRIYKWHDIPFNSKWDHATCKTNGFFLQLLMLGKYFPNKALDMLIIENACTYPHCSYKF